MINVCIYNEKKKELGFTFYLFGNEQYVIDYDKYKSSFDMKEYLEQSKADILGINIERFVTHCNLYISNPTFLAEEATENLAKATRWRANNRGDHKKFLNLVLRGRSMFNDLVNAFDEGDRKVRALMMCEMIMKFVEDELDDR